MTGFTVTLTGRRTRALVVGGGTVASRRAMSLVASRFAVRVVAPALSHELVRLAAELDAEQLTVVHRGYESGDIGDAQLVFAATNVRAVNAQVAADAHALNRLVNVADLPAEGDFVVPAQGGPGPLTVSVYAGGLPDGATRILAAIRERFDGRYADAVTALSALRVHYLRGGRPDEWARARAEMLGDDFCASVEDGRFETRLARWL